MNIWLSRIPTENEIKGVIEKLSLDKAPRPDGFIVRIFQVSWEVIKKDRTTAMTHLYLGRSMVRELNHTFITLVPKIQEVERMENFRPIFYVNTLYKIHTKLLADRLAGDCF